MFVLVNLKGYDCDSVSIADAAIRVNEAADGDVSVALAPQTALIGSVSKTGVETWAQHVSSNTHGSYTGSTLATAASAAGATGTLLNHSERRLQLASIDSAITRAKHTGLKTIVCANNPDQIAAVTALGPDAVAIEPPELIGTGTPVSQADPGIVRDAVTAAADIDRSVDVLCGAGISTGADVSAARDLGADGVLLASGVAKATDPLAALRELVSAV